ncbi:hypothetical protein HW49_03460 [Porphyromonadaceae bacterium COT-184 OH4590]|nr:hypothetical protein HW49_03460 [Porphyromonadaceae bacterium COT-184 OH4590]
MKPHRLRIRHKKKVRNYEKYSKKKKTTIFLPSNQHKNGCKNGFCGSGVLLMGNKVLGSISQIEKTRNSQLFDF